MKTATISELKTALSDTRPNQLVDICLRLAKFKKENKELLTYLLFEAFDEDAYVESVKEQMLNMFDEINMSGVYFIKKTLRRILRIVNKYIRFTGSADVEIRLLMFFCEQVISYKIPVRESAVINNMYQSQVNKIKNAVMTLHEDLQYDYLKKIEQIMQ